MILLIRTQRSITKRFDPNGAVIFPLFTACPEEILWPFIQITQPKNLDNEKEVSFQSKVSIILEKKTNCKGTGLYVYSQLTIANPNYLLQPSC